jgi:hypothetical protein
MTWMVRIVVAMAVAVGAVGVGSAQALTLEEARFYVVTTCRGDYAKKRDCNRCVEAAVQTLLTDNVITRDMGKTLVKSF